MSDHKPTPSAEARTGRQTESEEGKVMWVTLTETKEPVDPVRLTLPENFQETYGETHTRKKSTCCPSCIIPCRLRGVRIGKHALGVFLILCVTVIWVASSFWIQHIFGELNYEKPYFLTYFNTTGFALWNLGYLAISSWRRVPWNIAGKPVPIIFVDPHVKEVYGGSGPSADGITGDGANGNSNMGRDVDLLLPTSHDGKATDDTNANTNHTAPAPASAEGRTGAAALNNEPAGGNEDDGEEFLPCNYDGAMEKITPYSKLRLLRCACFFCPFWFLANYLFNLSLSRTSVASNTILSSTSSVWTLLLSVVLLGYRVTLFKVGAVVICISGSAMIAFSDGKGALANEGLIGDILALVSAMFYAVYTSVLKWVLPEDDRYSMAMAFGMVGIVNFLVFWPGLPILDAVNFEPFQLPTIHQLWPLVLNSIIGTNLSDVLWARSVVLTSPLVATLGLTLTTPLSMTVDAFWKRRVFSPMYISGALLVTLGFIIVNLEDSSLWACLRCFRKGPRRLPKS